MDKDDKTPKGYGPQRSRPITVDDGLRDHWSRVMAEVEREKNGCWRYPLTKDRDGYGVFQRHGRAYRAPRIAYAVEHGGIDPSLSVLHSCDRPECVNPSHLSLGTHRQNVLDGWSRGRVHHAHRNKKD